MTKMTVQTKALLLENLLLDAYLISQEIADLKRNLSLELQAARDERRAQDREFQEFMTDIRNTLDEIRAKHIVEAQLLDLIPQGPNDERGKKTNLQTSKYQ